MNVVLLLFSACQPEHLAPENLDLARADVDTLRDLAASWDRGEVVALVRHTERCDRSPDACVEGNTGITRSGLEVARNLGAGFRALALDASIIYSSSEKRAIQTAEAAFGDGILVRDWVRICKHAITPSLFANKESEMNLILVTHSTCMEHYDIPQKDLDYMNPDTYGAVIFLRLDSAMKAVSPFGYLKATDWAPFLARLERGPS